MGYVVRLLLNQKRTFKVQFASYVGGVQKVRDVPEEEARGLGFNLEAPIEVARRRRDEINGQLARERRIRFRGAIEGQLNAKDAKLVSHWLPPQLVREFELKVLFETVGRDSGEVFKRNKTASHWRAVRRAICHVDLDPMEWGERSRKYFDYFAMLQMSPAYVSKLIRLLNLWGKFVGKKSFRGYNPIEAPKTYERERLSDAFFDKAENGFASAPLSPQELDKRRGDLLTEHYNWLYLSVWFGLRPAEIDSLSVIEGKTWKESAKNGTPVLWVYQSKLKSVPRPQRWKPIPCIFSEQRLGIELVRGGTFQRPLAKTVRAHFGERVTCYGGRKGFVELMMSRGQTLENISAWLGHQELGRTWKSYRNKLEVSWTLPPALKENTQ